MKLNKRMGRYLRGSLFVYRRGLDKGTLEKGG